MTTIEMFKQLRINITSMCEYVKINQNTMSSKIEHWYDLTEREMIKFREYLDDKIRAMIKIMKKIDKVLDHNQKQKWK